MKSANLPDLLTFYYIEFSFLISYTSNALIDGEENPIFVGKITLKCILK